MKNTKLVDLKEGPLHSTNNYIEALKHMIDVPEIRDYIVMQILIAPMDQLSYQIQRFFWNTGTNSTYCSND